MNPDPAVCDVSYYYSVWLSELTKAQKGGRDNFWRRHKVCEIGGEQYSEVGVGNGNTGAALAGSAAQQTVTGDLNCQTRYSFWHGGVSRDPHEVLIARRRLHRCGIQQIKGPRIHPLVTLTVAIGKGK